MASLNLRDCHCVTDKKFEKVHTIYVKDKDGNIFIPWHQWHTRVINAFNGFTTKNITYWSNDVGLTNNFSESQEITELPIEIPRLLCSKMINEAEYDSMIKMIKSTDPENIQIVVSVIKGFRQRRLQGSKQKKRRRNE
jgi:hypothetical protein